MGSTMLSEDRLEERLLAKVEEMEVEAGCGSCYGAGEEGECCNSCEDVKRAYKRKGWLLSDYSEIRACKDYHQGYEDEDEGCNVHGVVALDSGGGNLHLAPGKDFNPKVPSKTDQFVELMLQTYQQWNVSHSVNKLRFGPEHPSGVFQLDGQQRVVEDTSAMYQYYIQVREVSRRQNFLCSDRVILFLTQKVPPPALPLFKDHPHPVQVQGRKDDPNQPGESRISRRWCLLSFVRP
jgi:hypothetical protein